MATFQPETDWTQSQTFLFIWSATATCFTAHLTQRAFNVNNQLKNFNYRHGNSSNRTALYRPVLISNDVFMSYQHPADAADHGIIIICCHRKELMNFSNQPSLVKCKPPLHSLQVKNASTTTNIKLSNQPVHSANTLSVSACSRQWKGNVLVNIWLALQLPGDGRVAAFTSFIWIVTQITINWTIWLKMWLAMWQQMEDDIQTH